MNDIIWFLNYSIKFLKIDTLSRFYIYSKISNTHLVDTPLEPVSNITNIASCSAFCVRKIVLIH